MTDETNEWIAKEDDDVVQEDEELTWRDAELAVGIEEKVQPPGH